MKILVVFLLLVAVISCDYLVINEDIISEINSDPESTWVAGRNEIFEGKTLSQVKNMLGALLVQPSNDHILTINSARGFAPSAFDSRTQWPTCIHAIRNQGQCGSCWAFAGSEVLSDRYCIVTKGEQNKVLSPQDMVSCDKGDYGCQGGYLDKLWDYIVKEGIVTEACFPYVSSSGSVPACPFTKEKKCVAGSTETYKKHKAKKWYHYANIDSAMVDMMEKGPFLGGFKVYQDFFQYKSGVYQHKSGSLAGGHAIKVVGWGVDTASKLDYWIVANSWGASWGMNGYFWILKGKNECELETQLYGADALDDAQL